MMNELLWGILFVFGIVSAQQPTQTPPAPKAHSCLLTSSNFGFIQAGARLHLRGIMGNATRDIANNAECNCPNPMSLGCVTSLGSRMPTSWFVNAPADFTTVGGWVTLRPSSNPPRALPATDEFIFSPIVATFDMVLSGKLAERSMIFDLTTPDWGFGFCSENMSRIGFAHYPCFLSQFQNDRRPSERMAFDKPFQLGVRDSPSERTFFFSIVRNELRSTDNTIISLFYPDRNWTSSIKTVTLPLVPLLQKIHFGNINRSSFHLSATFDTFFGAQDSVKAATAANSSSSLCFDDILGTPIKCTPVPSTPVPTPASTRPTSTIKTSLAEQQTANGTTELLQIKGNSEPVDTISIVLFVVAAILIIVGAGFVIVLLR